MVHKLEADTALPYAFHVSDAQLTHGAPGAAPVSVVIGMRTADGQVITGELQVPADRWPGLAIFTAHWEQAAERRPA